MSISGVFTECPCLEYLFLTLQLFLRILMFLSQADDEHIVKLLCPSLCLINDYEDSGHLDSAISLYTKGLKPQVSCSTFCVFKTLCNLNDVMATEL